MKVIEDLTKRPNRTSGSQKMKMWSISLQKRQIVFSDLLDGRTRPHRHVNCHEIKDLWSGFTLSMIAIVGALSTALTLYVTDRPHSTRISQTTALIWPKCLKVKEKPKIFDLFTSSTYAGSCFHSGWCMTQTPLIKWMQLFCSICSWTCRLLLLEQEISWTNFRICIMRKYPSPLNGSSAQFPGNQWCTWWNHEDKGTYIMSQAMNCNQDPTLSVDGPRSRALGCEHGFTKN